MLEVVCSVCHCLNVDKAVKTPAEKELVVPNGELCLCQSGLEPPADPLQLGLLVSGQCSHFSSIEKVIVAEQLLFFSILFLSCGVAHKLPYKDSRHFRIFVYSGSSDAG